MALCKGEQRFGISGYTTEKFRLKQDSKELSPRSLDEMLLKWQVNSQNVQSTQLSKFFKFSKFLKHSNCNNSYDSQTCLKMFKHV